MDARQWIVQPLVDAGLDAREITDLLLCLGCEAVTADGDVDARVRAVVDGHPQAVRTAWVEVLSRMLAAAEPAR